LTAKILAGLIEIAGRRSRGVIRGGQVRLGLRRLGVGGVYRPAHGSGTTARAGSWKTGAGGAWADSEIACDYGVPSAGDGAAGKYRETGSRPEPGGGRGQRRD
jgi:hypothetical protein